MSALLPLLVLLVLTQSAGLERRFANIAAAAQGKVGAAVLVLETGERAELNGGDRFPMQRAPLSMRSSTAIPIGSL